MNKGSGEGNGNPLQYSCPENSMDGRMGCGPWGHRVGHDGAINTHMTREASEEF